MEKLIGVTGYQCSGKDFIAELLRVDYGYEQVTSSDVIRDHIAAEGLGDPTRPLLNQTAKELRAADPTYILRKSLERTAGDKVVVSGLYSVSEADYFHKLGGVILRCDASREIRYQRALQRGRIGDGVDFETFCKWEESDDANTGEASQAVAAVGALADASIENNGTAEQLKAALDLKLKELRLT